MQQTWCFHLSLNVASLARALDFYRVLFDMEPAKCHDDYAKFEVVEPPVVFSLVPHTVGAEATRSRVGLTLSSTDHCCRYAAGSKTAASTSISSGQ